MDGTGGLFLTAPSLATSPEDALQWGQEQLKFKVTGGGVVSHGY